MVSRRASLLFLPLAVACAPVAGGDERPEPVASEEAKGALFVAGKFGNTLAKIDLASGEQVAIVDSCANPHELATSPDDAHVALACYGGQTVDIFRTSDLSRVTSIDLGANARPHGIVWHENGEIFATAEGRQSIFRITGPLTAAPETHEYASGKRGTHMLAVSPDGGRAWTTDLGSRTVTAIDLSRRDPARSVEVGNEPEGIALSADGDTLWVSARGSDKAFAIDPAALAVRQEVETGRFPLRIAVSPQGDYAVTSDLADGGLTVIDTATGEAVRSITVAGADGAEERVQVTILWSPDGERIYVAETRADRIAEVDFASGETLRYLPGKGGGDGLAIIN